MSAVDDKLRLVRLKCRQLSESQSSLESSVNDDVYNKLAVLMQCHEEIKIILKLINDKKDKSKIKLTKNIEIHQHLLKVLNNRHQENKILEEYISEAKNQIEMIENIKQENDYFRLFHDKNTTKITQLKEKIAHVSRLSFNTGKPIQLDSDDEFLGFDSVTVSTPCQNDSHQSFYYKIKQNSADFQNSVNSLLSVMKETNSSIQTAVESIDSFTSQVTDDVKSVQQQLTRILRDDKAVIKELEKKRCDLEQIKMNNFCHLSLLESDLESLGNRVKTKRLPAQNAYENYIIEKIIQSLDVVHVQTSYFCLEAREILLFSEK